MHFNLRVFLNRKKLFQFFRSFWAMFGWMAVPIDTRIYLALRLLTIVVLLGLFMRVVDSWGTGERPSPALLLLQ